jgi:hypothetical protein
MTTLFAILALSASAFAGTNPDMGDTKLVKRGGDFTGATKATLDDVAATPDKFAGKTVEISGTVGTVCVKKGCWLGLTGTKPAVHARVTFKDYAFFAPMDSKGATARVEGVVEVKKMSDAEREHLAKDEGKPVAEVPAVELRIMASALELTRK